MQNSAATFLPARTSGITGFLAFALFFSTLLFGHIGEAQAQQVPTQNYLAADRPGLGDRAATVSARTFQTELGYVFSNNGFRSDVGSNVNPLPHNTHEFGQLLFRLGITDVLELRTGLGSYVLNEDPVDNGYAGTTVGVKARLFRDETSTLTGMATLGLPFGTGPFETPDDRARQQLKLVFNGALGTGVALEINSGTRFYYASGSQDDRFVEWLFIPTLNVGLGESADAYVGYGGFYHEGPNTNWVEAGLTFLTSIDTQLDINAGFRVDDNVPGNEEGYFVGVGLAHRF